MTLPFHTTTWHIHYKFHLIRFVRKSNVYVRARVCYPVYLVWSVTNMSCICSNALSKLCHAI